MSQELKTNMKKHSAVTFWGGEKGMMLQVTATDPITSFEPNKLLQTEGFITLTVLEAFHLYKTLVEFINKNELGRVVEDEVEG